MFTRRVSTKVPIALICILLVFMLFTPLANASSLGDINGDGDIDVQDVVLVMRHVLELDTLTPNQKLLADVNHDKDIDVTDVVLIMRYALGIITEFPEPEPELVDEVNSRLNPAKIGETIVTDGDDFRYGYHKYEVELKEVVKGDLAWQMIAAANMLNEPPEEGMVYILAKFRFKLLEIEKEPFSLNHAKFDAVSKDGTVYSQYVSVVVPAPNLRTDLYKGAEHEGWTYFMVDQNDEPLAVWDRTWNTEIWFELRSNLLPGNGENAVPEDNDTSAGSGDHIILPSEPLYLYADDDTYLGKLTTNRFDSESIYNEFGSYGSPFSATSIWNEFGTYGSPFSNLSAFNDLATRPPHILTEDKREVGRLTTNRLIYKAIDPDDLEDALIAAGL